MVTYKYSTNSSNKYAGYGYGNSNGYGSGIGEGYFGGFGDGAEDYNDIGFCNGDGYSLDYYEHILL